MAEIIYKKVSELDGATVPFVGTEVVMAIQGGASKKATWSGIFGSGWWAKLAAAFSAFVAPEALHADDADTLVSETPSDFHDAAQLTGNINLDRIPAELTGKNAATATLAAGATVLATARTIGGVSFNGSANINLPGVNAAGNQNTSGNADTATLSASSTSIAYGSSGSGGRPSASVIYNGWIWYNVTEIAICINISGTYAWVKIN